MENNNMLVDTPNNLFVDTPKLVDSSDFFEGRRFVYSVGGLAIGLLGLEILLQQNTYWGGLSSWDFLEQKESIINFNKGELQLWESSAGLASPYGNRKKSFRKSRAITG
jgi:hypothetical protein